MIIIHTAIFKVRETSLSTVYQLQEVTYLLQGYIF